MDDKFIGLNKDLIKSAKENLNKIQLKEGLSNAPVNQNEITLSEKISILESKFNLYKEKKESLFADIFQKLEKIERITIPKIRKIELHTESLCSTIDSLNDFIKLLDEEKGKRLLVNFKKEISEMHSLIKILLNKLTIMSSAGWVAKYNYPHDKNRIIEKLYEALDLEDEWWNKLENKTLGEIIEILIDKKD